MVAAPGAKYPLHSYLAVEANHVSAVQSVMQSALKDIDAKLALLQGKTNISSQISRMQAEAQRVAIKSHLQADFSKIGAVVADGQKAAAKAASAVISAYEETLTGRIADPQVLKLIRESEALRAASNIDTLMARQNASHLPLSQQVYKSSVAAMGPIDTIINAELAKGSNAAEFAKAIREHINPATPGGPAYAAKRLARTEINNAFHAATIERAQKSGLAEGVDWKLSSSHPENDECDEYAAHGTFKFGQVPSKPHPFCLCFLVPALPSDEDFINNLFNGDYGDAPAVPAPDPKVLPPEILAKYKAKNAHLFTEEQLKAKAAIQAKKQAAGKANAAKKAAAEQMPSLADQEAIAKMVANAKAKLAATEAASKATIAAEKKIAQKAFPDPTKLTPAQKAAATKKAKADALQSSAKLTQQQKSAKAMSDQAFWDAYDAKVAATKAAKKVAEPELTLAQIKKEAAAKKAALKEPTLAKSPAQIKKEAKAVQDALDAQTLKNAQEAALASDKSAVANYLNNATNGGSLIPPSMSVQASAYNLAEFNAGYTHNMVLKLSMSDYGAYKNLNLVLKADAEKLLAIPSPAYLKPPLIPKPAAVKKPTKAAQLKADKAAQALEDMQQSALLDMGYTMQDLASVGWKTDNYYIKMANQIISENPGVYNAVPVSAPVKAAAKKAATPKAKIPVAPDILSYEQKMALKNAGVKHVEYDAMTQLKKNKTLNDAWVKAHPAKAPPVPYVKTAQVLDNTPWAVMKDLPTISEGSAATKAAAKKYSGSSYSEMNGYLRGKAYNQNPSASIIKAVKDLTAGLKKITLKEPKLMFRGTGYRSLGLDSLSEAPSLVGKVFKNDAFVSTSGMPTTAGANTPMSQAHFPFMSTGKLNLRILAPKGTPGANIVSVSQFASEAEYLIPPNTAFKFLSVEHDTARNMWYADVELIITDAV